jgi:hypothetical protein
VCVQLQRAHTQVELVGEAQQLVVGVQRGVGEVVQRPLYVLEEAWAMEGGGSHARRVEGHGRLVLGLLAARWASTNA